MFERRESLSTSRIPRKSITSQFASGSTTSRNALTTRTSAENNVIQKLEPVKSEICKVKPTRASMSKRSLPESLSEHAKIVGNTKELEQLYNYCRSIANEYFSDKVAKHLFPSAFIPAQASRISFMSTNSRESISSVSRIPMSRKSTMTTTVNQDGSFSLNSGFKHLNSLFTTHPKQVLALTDFCVLYCSLVIAICDAKNADHAFQFLDKFFTLEIKRTSEFSVLLQVLLHAGYDGSQFREQAIKIISNMVKLDESLKERIINGSTSSDSQVQSLCEAVINESHIEPSKPSFKAIPPTANEEEAIEIFMGAIDLMSDSVMPENQSEIIRSYAQTMLKFSQSPQLLNIAGTCLTAFFQEKNDQIQPEVLSEVLSLCFSISCGDIFLEGEDSFEAQESIKGFIELSMQNTETKILIKSLCSVIQQSSGNKLNFILDTMKNSENINSEDLQPITDIMVSFHPNTKIPEFLPQSSAPAVEEIVKQESFEEITVEESVRRLLNEETVCDEIIRIVNSSQNGNFDDYPEYLRSTLSAAWNEASPVPDIDELIEEAKVILGDL